MTHSQKARAKPLENESADKRIAERHPMERPFGMNLGSQKRVKLRKGPSRVKEVNFVAVWWGPKQPTLQMKEKAKNPEPNSDQPKENNVCFCVSGPHENG